MNEEKKATSVLDVYVPHKMVELQDLKTAGGDAVTVRCERPDAIEMFRISQTLPGAREMAGEDEAGRPDLMSDQQRLEMVRNYAPPLVEAGTMLEGPDGPVQPAFYFGGPNRHPLSLPGSILSARDLMTLADTVASLAGYGPTEVPFRNGDGAGSGDSVGAGSGGDEVRPDTVGSPA